MSGESRTKAKRASVLIFFGLYELDWSFSSWAEKTEQTEMAKKASRSVKQRKAFDFVLYIKISFLSNIWQNTATSVVGGMKAAFFFVVFNFEIWVVGYYYAAFVSNM